jgi:PiT family inorganic phosphate transporter
MALIAETGAVVAVTLAWAVTGGMHDTATLTAGAIASRALSPARAVLVFGGFGFLGPLVVGTAVASNIASFVDLGDLSPAAGLGTVAAGLGAAMAWNLLTWYFGIPSSATQGLVGGLVGATLASGGPDDVRWGFAALAHGDLEGVALILVALVVSPVLGLAAGFVVQRIGALSLRGASVEWNRRLRRGQVLTVAGLAFAHGANEAQKSMGVIALALTLGGVTDALEVPPWVMIASASTIPVGALVGGWGIVRTLGYGIFHLRPLHAAGAQIGAASVIGVSSALGGPVSTGHVASSAVIGVGAADRPRAVRWEAGKAILLAWLLTLPATATLGAMIVGIGRAIAAAG